MHIITEILINIVVKKYELILFIDYNILILWPAQRTQDSKVAALVFISGPFRIYNIAAPLLTNNLLTYKINLYICDVVILKIVFY